MVTRPVQCAYYKECSSKSSTKCRQCKNNKVRNMEMDYFVNAKDNPIPDVNPRVTYSGPAEQTMGYQCPVCGEHTNPYAMRDNRCGACGFKLNVG